MTYTSGGNVYQKQATAWDGIDAIGVWPQGSGGNLPELLFDLRMRVGVFIISYLRANNLPEIDIISR
jgi:hypothetical protein